MTCNTYHRTSAQTKIPRLRHAQEDRRCARKTGFLVTEASEVVVIGPTERLTAGVKEGFNGTVAVARLGSVILRLCNPYLDQVEQVRLAAFITAFCAAFLAKATQPLTPLPYNAAQTPCQALTG